VLAWCAALLLAIAQVNAQDQPDWRFSLQGTYQYGSVDGYIQTPNGGEPNTTSNKRPKLSELGINNTSVYDAEVTAARNNDSFYLGGQWIQMSGSNTLDSDLVSHGQTFPAGSHVDASVDLDWYRLGYRRRIALGHAGEWTISPSVGAAVLDFRYQLHDATASVDRSYIKLNAQFGLDVEWRPRSGPFSLDLALLGCPPITPPLPQMAVEQLVAKYQLIQRAKMDLDVFGGVGFEQIYYEDNQAVSNHVNANFGPMWIIGLNLHF